jgi:hypothetical protein
MLGTKRTVPLWRQRQTRPLALERSLARARNDDSAGRVTSTEKAVAGSKAQGRRLVGAKRKTRFFED